MLSHWLCNFRTGERLLEIRPSERNWARALNVAEGGSHVWDLSNRAVPRSTAWNLTTPWDRVLVMCWNDKPFYAGVITGRPYDWNTKRVTLNHTDVRSVFTGRYPFGVNSYWADPSETIPGRLVLSNLSLRAIAANVIEQGLMGPVPIYGAPIWRTSTTEPGPHSRVYENFNFQKVADILDELQNADGGPDIEFAPQWSPSTGLLEWIMRAGSPAAPALTGGTISFNLTAEKSGLSDFTIDEDALNQVTGVFGVGEGSGADMIVGGTPGLAIADIPARDDVVNYRNAKSNAEASSLATEHVKAHWKATWQPSFAVQMSDFDPTTLVLGSKVSIYDKDDPWNPDGWQDYRLVKISGSSDDKVILTVQGMRV